MYEKLHDNGIGLSTTRSSNSSKSHKPHKSSKSPKHRHSVRPDNQSNDKYDKENQSNDKYD